MEAPQSNISYSSYPRAPALFIWRHRKADTIFSASKRGLRRFVTQFCQA